MTAKDEARRARREAGKDVYCAWCGKEIGDWSSCECYRRPVPVMRLSDVSEEWNADCLQWRGRLLTGLKAHWCWDWDFLPIDETTPEWPCPCRMSDEEEGR